MVQIQQYLKRTNNIQNSSSLPMLNSLFVENFSRYSSPGYTDNGFKTFIKWARRSPQLMGFADIIVTDMLSDEISFCPIDPENGKEKSDRAKFFWESNGGMEIPQETLYDLILLGIGYNWVGKIDDIQLKEFMKKAINKTMPELKEKDLEVKSEELVDKYKKSNLDKIAKKLRHVAASTMSMQTNKYEVVKYVQRVGAETKEYSKDEILTFKLMPFDGKVYPFPPMEAIFSEVYLLWLITQNYVSFFENGGKPDNVFILPKELAGSKNHQYLIDTLKKYKKIQNKHGNLVFTGDLSIEKLMEVEHQMENKDLGLYLTSVLAMLYGVPVNRIPFLIGKAAAGGDSGGLADSGYWRKISVWQSKLENIYNQKLWIPYFGVRMKFSRGYLQDEVRETQNEMQKTQIAEQRMRLGLWTSKKAGEYLNIDEKDIEEAKKEKDEEIKKSGMLMQNLDIDSNVIKEPDAKLRAKQRQDTQNKNQQNAGGKKINP